MYKVTLLTTSETAPVGAVVSRHSSWTSSVTRCLAGADCLLYSYQCHFHLWISDTVRLIYQAYRSVHRLQCTRFL